MHAGIVEIVHGFGGGKKKKFKKVKTKNKIKKITESPTETKILLLSALNCLNKD